MQAVLAFGRLAFRMEALINAANALYLIAYFARDMRWLRALTIVAAGLLAVYFFLLPEPVLAAVIWNLVFGALNAYQLLRLVARARRRPTGAAKERPPRCPCSASR